ncbi:phasin family protein [Pseudoxanthomonas suwonensis]|uniref:phasin family protein n=1 Tax=Pseudoxanthomonas suwonensis TaxID=314722 RepID=UPI00138F3A26|nr:phasin family protein [Pseudoxanthomonas suwonensis]KAF1702014.1 poly(hydroxyalkanoate) granule-associated protein [Pseudoxanthomonas suwonensis]
MTAENRHREIPSAADIQAQAGRFARELGDSAQQVWLAGIGALARAQAEGSRIFEQLAEEGRAVGEGQDASSASAAARLESLRQALDGALGRVTAKANEAWDSVGRSFEHRVQQALRQMDVPTREDFDALGARIDALTRELRLRTAAQPEPVVPPAPTAGNIHTHPDANIG